MTGVIWSPVFQVNISGQLPSPALWQLAGAELEGWRSCLLRGERGLHPKREEQLPTGGGCLFADLPTGLPRQGGATPPTGLPGAGSRAGRDVRAAAANQQTQPGWRRRLSAGSAHPHETAPPRSAPTPLPLQRGTPGAAVTTSPTRAAGADAHVPRRRVPGGPRSHLSSHPPAGARPPSLLVPPGTDTGPGPAAPPAPLRSAAALTPRQAAARAPRPPRRPRPFPASAHPTAGNAGACAERQ